MELEFIPLDINVAYALGCKVAIHFNNKRVLKRGGSRVETQNMVIGS